MRVAIPTEDQAGLEGTVAGHFGHASFFTLVDTDTDEVQIQVNDGKHHGGAMTPAEILAQAGAETVLCAGLGRRAVRFFEESGITVMMGAGGTVAETLKAYRHGRLTPADEEKACPGHHHADD